MPKEIRSPNFERRAGARSAVWSFVQIISMMITPPSRRQSQKKTRSGQKTKSEVRADEAERKAQPMICHRVAIDRRQPCGFSPRERIAQAPRRRVSDA